MMSPLLILGGTFIGSISLEALSTVLISDDNPTVTIPGFKLPSTMLLLFDILTAEQTATTHHGAGGIKKASTHKQNGITRQQADTACEQVDITSKQNDSTCEQKHTELPCLELLRCRCCQQFSE